ncbi:MAG: FkbM family methyltransferase [bacterium]|nr:FkbM family methyltransferase [bacterium]
MKTILEKIAKQFMGRGIDKKFPFLVWLYKKTYTSFTSEAEIETLIPLKSKLLVSSRDSGLGLMLRTKGKFEPTQTKSFINSIKKGNTVFDIGANVGYYSVLASKLVGKDGKVFAFEPDSQNLKLLYKNLRINHCNNVVVSESALGNKQGKLTLTQDVSNPGESSLSVLKHGNKVLVDVITLDKFVKKQKIRTIDLIKMDVEGAELNVLRGGLKTLQNNKKIKIFIECNPSTLKDFNEDKIVLCAFLKGLNFDIQGIIDEKNKNIKKYSDKILDIVLNKIGFTNLIAIKNKEFDPKPKISVLMTAYNAEKYIGNAIESILKQSYKNFEFVVVDDKSTDGTLDIIKEYRKKDKRIKIISLKKNLGPSLTANFGLKNINSQYLARMDADDISEIDRLEKQIVYLQDNPEISMLGGQCKLIDSEGCSIGRKLFPIDHNSIFTSLFSRNPIQHPACMINLNNLTISSILHGGKSVLAHDLELVFLASKYGKLANIDDYVLKYRQYPKSFSLMNPKKTFWQTFEVRIQSILKYKYIPTLKGVITTLAQVVFIVIMPNKWIYPVYLYTRGIKKIDIRSVKINLYANIFPKKAYELAQG